MALRTACGIAVCVCALTAALTAAGCGQAASSATPAVSGAPEQGPEAPDVAASTAPATTAVTTQESDSAVGPVTITIVYDNTSTGPELSADWGFACVIETGGPTILFDTGASGPILLGNLRALGIPPADIDAVVISHAHSDHTGGLKDFLRENSAVTLFVPASFPEGTRTSIAEGGTVVEVVTSGREILPGVSTTGELPGPPAEQALVL